MFFMKRAKKTIPFEMNLYALGTVNQIKVYGKNGEKALDEASKRLYEIDNKMSAFKDYSEISKINKSAGKSFEKVSEDTYYVIKKAIEYSNLSEGAFNPAVRPLVNLWGIGTDHQEIPKDSDIKNTLKLINYKDILLDDKNRSVMLKVTGQCVDLGAIAKGYAADQVKKILKKNGIKSAIIDLGGNIYALGNKPDGAPWRVGIQNPLTFRGDYMGTVNVTDKSVVTSGNYERYFIKDGRRFHHILDSRTGYPSQNGIISATIISDYSIDGDGLSTCAYVMGLEEGIKLVESTDRAEGIMITEDNKLHVTSGIKGTFEIINHEFKY